MNRLLDIWFFSRSHKLLSILVGCEYSIVMITVGLAYIGLLSMDCVTAMILFIFALPLLRFCGVLEKEHKEIMEDQCPSFWTEEFHRAVAHDDWVKIHTYASIFRKIFERYAYFYICTDTFHDLPLQQLERALNILAEKNPEYFTEKLIETVLSDAENGLKNTYLVDFGSKETLEIKNLTDN